jgi:hypothetical protein
LALWARLLESGPPGVRPVIVQTLSHWLNNTDLAGIRGPAALTNLPEEEWKAFAQLWADVAAQLKKAEAKPN